MKKPSPVQMTLTPRTWSELFLLAFIWGGSFLAVHIALEEIGPLTAVVHRTGWAMVILWTIVIIRRLPVPHDPKVWFAFLIMGLLNNVIPFSLMAWGQLHVQTGLTSILNAATAIFGVIAAAIFFADERLTLRRVIGVGLGFLGVATAIGLSNLGQLDLRSLGQLAIIGGTMGYALAGVWARKRLPKLSPVVAAAGMVTGATLIMLPLTIVVEGPITLKLSVKTWGAIGYYSAIATAFAYLMYYRVLSAAGSGNLMLVTLLIPPVAIVLGALVLDEALPLRAYAGFALLAVGLMVLNGWLVPRKHRTRGA